MQWSCCAIWWEGERQAEEELQKLLPHAAKPCTHLAEEGSGGHQGKRQWEATGSPCSGIRSTSPPGRAALQPSPGGQGCEEDGQ